MSLKRVNFRTALAGQSLHSITSNDEENWKEITRKQSLMSIDKRSGPSFFYAMYVVQSTLGQYSKPEFLGKIKTFDTPVLTRP